MAALNLTIESAPTRPRERARDDFTIVITRVVVRPKIIKFFEKSNLFESDVENYKERKIASELRTINEDQLQEAVKFLTAVWQGEIEATPVQVAAARCFMRAE